ncbi:MAG: sterol desaturase family protein [Flavobacteriales bacterium]|nr:sterol desaturase family protein [Flavobacteriales bacterium]MBK7942388.1 sterol desaturase family protein [Flavobacteriales bacterium]MBK9699210.1 sterol desaturase family protein [Flavobacteriales bacterium]
MEYIILSIPLFFLLMGIELAWSAWSGRQVYRLNDFIANLGCGIGSQVVGAFTKAVIFAGYLWTYDHLRVFTLPATALTWIVAFLLVDLLYYWFHRLSHEVNFLWAAHIVHHQSEEYNLSVALRQSWWQGLFSWWFYVPMAVLGIHPLLIVTVGAFNTLYQFWIHTKAIGRMGPLEAVFNTPSHHRVHHGSDPKYIDRNHAGTLIVWDRLFGTFQREEEEPVYGITTPLASWDPVKANFHYWGDLFGLAGRCTRWSDKLRVFLKPPGWRPAELGGFQGPHAKDRKTYRVFDTSVDRRTRVYTGAQFALLLLVTSLFLFRQQHLAPWMQGGVALLIIWWVMNMGLMMEGGRPVLLSEAARIAAFTVLGVATAKAAAIPWAPGAVLVLALLSAVHLAFIALRKHRS